jgi:hypothetical protein
MGHPSGKHQPTTLLVPHHSHMMPASNAKHGPSTHSQTYKQLLRGWDAALPADDDPTATPPVPSSQAPAHRVDRSGRRHLGMPEPATTVSEYAPPTPSLTSNCSWGGLQVEQQHKIVGSAWLQHQVRGYQEDEMAPAPNTPNCEPLFAVWIRC